MIEIAILRGEPRQLYRAPDGTEGTSRGGICRALIGAGMDPATPVVFRWASTGTVASVPRSIGHWAARAVSDTDTGISRVFWAPHPNATMPPALAAWHAETASQRVAVRVAAAEARKALAVPA